MRPFVRTLAASLCGLCLMTLPAWAQSPVNGESRPAAEKTTGGAAADDTSAASTTGLDVPVSLDRIREALAQPPAETLKGLNEQPTFRLQVLEHQKIQQVLEGITFEAPGPEVAGGRTTYEIQRLIFPPVDNPLVQPYGAFNTGEVLTLAAEALIEKAVASKVSNVFTGLFKAQAEREAREEVARTLAALQAPPPAAAPPSN
jgi:hypothetical protein